MAIQHPIPVNVLRQLVRLDPETGRLYWLPRGPEWFRDNGHNGAASWNTKYAGKLANSFIDARGYHKITIFGRKYYAHRVVFALHHGRWPDGDTDHANGDKGDNRPYNLREATRGENMQNVMTRHGSSRFCGVSWHKSHSKWQAFCVANHKTHWLGYFPTEIDAARAYDDAAISLHGEFARLNFPGRHQPSLDCRT